MTFEWKLYVRNKLNFPLFYQERTFDRHLQCSRLGRRMNWGKLLFRTTPSDIRGWGDGGTELEIVFMESVNLPQISLSVEIQFSISDCESTRQRVKIWFKMLPVFLFLCFCFLMEICVNVFYQRRLDKTHFSKLVVAIKWNFTDSTHIQHLIKQPSFTIRSSGSGGNFTKKRFKYAVPCAHIDDLKKIF